MHRTQAMCSNSTYHSTTSTCRDYSGEESQQKYSHMLLYEWVNRLNLSFTTISDLNVHIIKCWNNHQEQKSCFSIGSLIIYLFRNWFRYKKKSFTTFHNIFAFPTAFERIFAKKTTILYANPFTERMLECICTYREWFKLVRTSLKHTPAILSFPAVVIRYSTPL